MTAAKREPVPPLEETDLDVAGGESVRLVTLAATGSARGCWFGSELLQFLQFGADDDSAIGLVGVTSEVVLVVILRGIERGQREDFGDNGFREVGGGLLAGLFGGGLLLVVVREDDGAVLGTFVATLSVHGGGVVSFPKDLEDLVVGDDGGVEVDLNDLGVAGVTGADGFVGGVGGGAAGVA